MKRILSFLCFAVIALGFVPSTLSGEGAGPEFWRKVLWTTSDGVKMVGLYHGASRPAALTWVLLHGLGSTVGEWDAFARKLAEQGNGIFLYDARGHGSSQTTVKGERLSYRNWQSAGPGTPWDAMPSDLASAAAVLHRTQGVPEKQIAVGGASLGANVALVYASQHPMVPALVLLSPGAEYAGIQTAEAWTRYYPRKVMLAASPEDAYAYATVNTFCQNSGYSYCPKIEGHGTAHGVAMFQDKEFTKKLLAWMKG